MASDSAYVFELFPGIVITSLNSHKHVVQELLQKLQVLLKKYSESF